MRNTFFSAVVFFDFSAPPVRACPEARADDLRFCTRPCFVGGHDGGVKIEIILAAISLLTL